MVDGVTRKSYLSRDMHLFYSLESKKVISPATVLVNQFVTKSLLTLTGCDVNLSWWLREVASFLSQIFLLTLTATDLGWLTDNKCLERKVFLFLFCLCIFVHTPLLNSFPSFLELLSLCVAKTSCVHLGGLPTSNCRSGSVLIRAHLQSLADAQAQHSTRGT